MEKVKGWNEYLLSKNRVDTEGATTEDVILYAQLQLLEAANVSNKKLKTISVCAITLTIISAVSAIVCVFGVCSFLSALRDFFAAAGL